MCPRAVTVQDLADAAAGSIVLGTGGSLVTGLVYDSRAVTPGDLFAALRGADLDGHAFIDEAIARGASVLLVEREVTTALPQIVVRDGRAALAEVSAAFYDHPSRQLGVIGITGTDGKTTTSHLVDHLLRHAGARTGMVGTVAIRIGDAETLHPSRQTTPESNEIQMYLRQMVDARAEWAVLEATSHGLAMHRLDQVRFRIGAVTNITHEHLDYHGTVEQYRRAKALLLERVGAEAGYAIVNLDDPGAMAIAPHAAGATVMAYSASGGPADVRAVDVQSDATGSTFVLDSGPTGSTDVTLPHIGEFNVANALCAAAVAMAAGQKVGTIASGLATAPAVPGRMARIDAGQPFAVIVDYAHTPDALAKVLTLLRRLHPQGRLIVVFGSAGERDVEKRSRQGAVAARLADISVLTSEDPRFEDAEAIITEIAIGAVAAGAEPDRSLYRRTDRREAVELAIGLARAGDCVLLAGKGHEGSIIWGRDKMPWNEADVARDSLRAAGYASSAS